MKKAVFIFMFLIVGGSLHLLSVSNSPSPCYEDSYVELSTPTYNNEDYIVIMMNMTGKRIKAKYFAAPDNGKSVFKRYSDWIVRVKNIVLVSSGTYMDNCHDLATSKPVGLTIDNGVPVTRTLIASKMDALTIVYPAGDNEGGIVVSNLADGDLTLKGGGVDAKRKFNLRKSVDDLDDFMEWAEEQEATVFQTHLLVYKNILKVSANNSSMDKRERRFLAVGKDPDNQVFHIILNCPASASLYNASKKALEFLNKFKEINVTFMINLDTGCQNVIELHNSNCTINKAVKGTQTIDNTVNLLAYYFQ